MIKQSLLLTAFEPFAGRPKNGSAWIAEAAVKLLEPHFNVHFHLLPVHYEGAASLAIEAMKKLPGLPDFVVSLGEAAGDLRLETRFQNLDHRPGLPDNKGEIRVQAKIIPGGPEYIPATLPLPAMFQVKRIFSDLEIRASQTAGNFVCNGTAFRLAAYCGKLKIPYGFIHVPTFTSGEEVLGRSAAAIALMFTSGMKQAGNSSRIIPMPCSMPEVQSLLDSCKSEMEKEFWESLALDYQNKDAGQGA